MEHLKDSQARLKHISSMLQPLVQELPKTLSGVELHRIMSQLLEGQSEEWRLELQAQLTYFLERMEVLEASDIDIGSEGSNGRIWYRIHGNKAPVELEDTLSVVEMDLLLLNLLMSKQREMLFEKRNFDFSHAVQRDNSDEKQRFRADMYYEMEHLALNMRRIENYIRPFKDLELHPEVGRALSLRYYQYGLTLVTGITGSGKSATLDTIIDANNRSVEAHVVIVASPIEMVHKSRKCIIRHREVGRDVWSFKEGVVQALRQDPDIIMIGELRDPETIMSALEITDSGHKTFGTLHTSSAMETIDRIVGETEVDEQERVRNRLADVLTCIISQKLVPSLDGKRVLAKEVLLVTPSVKAAIRNNNVGEIYQMLMEGSSRGMFTMEQDLFRLFNRGLISGETAMNYCNNKKRMYQLLNPSTVNKLNSILE